MAVTRSSCRGPALWGPWSELAARHDGAQLMELLTVAGWYRPLAYIINGLGIPLEAWAPRFPPG